MTMAMAGGPYKVPRRHDGWRSVALAVGMHALLFLFLWGGIRWQNEQPTAVEAEVWDLSTQQAAPPPEPQPEVQPEPEPPPPPVKAAPPEEVAPPKADPEIALRKEREKKEKERKLAEEKKKEELQRQEEEKLAELKKQQEDKKKKELAEKKAAEAKAQKIRDENMRRMMAQAAGTGSTGTAEKSTAPRLDSGYVAAITAKIKSNIAYTGGDVPGNPRAEFKISQLPTGEIISVRKIKSSGIPAYDTAVENAIMKSSPLPKKKDGTVERDINAGFNLKDLP
jgi:colicin import membrane protein